MRPRASYALRRYLFIFFNLYSQASSAQSLRSSGRWLARLLARYRCCHVGKDDSQLSWHSPFVRLGNFGSNADAIELMALRDFRICHLPHFPVIILLIAFVLKPILHFRRIDRTPWHLHRSAFSHRSGCRLYQGAPETSAFLVPPLRRRLLRIRTILFSCDSTKAIENQRGRKSRCVQTTIFDNSPPIPGSADSLLFVDLRNLHRIMDRVFDALVLLGDHHGA